MGVTTLRKSLYALVHHIIRIPTAHDIIICRQILHCVHTGRWKKSKTFTPVWNKNNNNVNVVCSPRSVYLHVFFFTEIHREVEVLDNVKIWSRRLTAVRTDQTHTASQIIRPCIIPLYIIRSLSILSTAENRYFRKSSQRSTAPLTAQYNIVHVIILGLGCLWPYKP